MLRKSQVVEHYTSLEAFLYRTNEILAVSQIDSMSLELEHATIDPVNSDIFSPTIKSIRSVYF
jgi:hypothetical protein